MDRRYGSEAVVPLAVEKTSMTPEDEEMIDLFQSDGISADFGDCERCETKNVVRRESDEDLGKMICETCWIDEQPDDDDD
jgi:hypothetical protein